MGRLTNYPFGVTSFGIPVLGSAVIPYTGNYWFVDPVNGLDGNSGQSPNNAFATLTAALANVTNNNNDVVYLMGTGSLHTTATINWTPNFTHLFGVCAPLRRGKRARISPSPSLAGTAGFNNLFNVTGSGCHFGNFQAFYGFSNSSTALQAWKDTGGRNVYDNVEFLGFGDGTASTGSSNLTGSRALLLSDNTGEMTFRRCVFGVDTEARGATNYTVELAGGLPRITFEDCDFEAYIGSGGTAGSHVLIDASGIDRYLDFLDCRFHNAVGSGASAMAQCFNVNAAPGGRLIVSGASYADGITAWQTTPTTDVFYTLGIPGASGAGGIAIEV